MCFLSKLPVVLWLAATSAQALDLSVPYLRDGLPYFDADGAAGFGAIVGHIEVRGAEGNGIDGFDGHRHGGLGPNPGDLYYGSFGYRDVQDFSGANDPTDNNFHGTFVAGVMAGEYTSVSDGTHSAPFLGVAPLALYYGAIFDGSGTKEGFLSLNSSLHYVLQVSGASVVNNSWGSNPTDAAQLNGSSFGESLLMDEYAGYAGKAGGTTHGYLDRLMVISAGNSGEDTGLLGSPADSFNGLSVGALDVVNPAASGLFDTGRAPVARVAPYSSWRPLADGRAGVHVVAPGTNLWSTLAINYANQNDLVAGVASGTSFAAPHVAGEAALLYGATSGLFLTDKGTLLFGADHKLIKALIINSAVKIPGLDATGAAQTTWQPGLVTTTNGVPNAVVPLNYAVGAGSANAREAFEQLREATGSFWEMDTLLTSGTERFYTFGTGKFVSGSPDQPFLLSLTATLVWDRHVDFTVSTDPLDESLGDVTKDLLSNLDLILQQETAPGVWEDVYMSAGTLDNVEHIYLPALAAGANYRLDVRGTAIAEPAIGENYALVVAYGTVPEPGVAGLLILGVFVVGARRRAQRGARIS
ncbi:MAG: S8 family serine peptidase [Chthoniobacter sp.]|nr:S8 family serine peptidase [Chthoniobacter sp.]